MTTIHILVYLFKYEKIVAIESKNKIKFKEVLQQLLNRIMLEKIPYVIAET